MTVWRWVRGYKGLYRVSDSGKVKSYHQDEVNGKLLRPADQGYGYLVVSLSKKSKAKTCLVHRLVAQTFIPNPKNRPEVNHKDGNKYNNNMTNLEWRTKKGNMRHSARMGLHAHGDSHVLAKLSDEDVRKIKMLLKQTRRATKRGNLTQAHIAEMFNVHQSNISHINRGATRVKR